MHEDLIICWKGAILSRSCNRTTKTMTIISLKPIAIGRKVFELGLREASARAKSQAACSPSPKAATANRDRTVVILSLNSDRKTKKKTVISSR